MKKIIVLMLMMVCLFSTAQALLNLELNQGKKSALPVAIVPFSGQGNLSDDERVSDIIQDDFSHSGEFKLTPVEALPSQPHAINDIKVSEWRGSGAEHVIVGSIRLLSNHRYQVVVSLVGVYKAAADDHIDPSSVLFSKVYEVNQADLRKLAHHISDWAYQELTNTRGVFSTKIAYVVVDRQKDKTWHQLMVADYDGFNAKSVVKSDQPIMSPVWSPNNDALAFVSFQKILPAIYQVELKTGNITQLTKLAGINGAPAWSPDALSMAFVSSRTGQAKIYRQILASKKVTQLTSGYSIDTEPSYSADGSSLLFTSSRGGSPQIYQYTFATQKIERLTYRGKYNARASYSPDGKHMVMLHREEGDYYIALQDLDTDAVTVLTKTGMDESPSFAPNGKMIIYATVVDGQHELALVSSDGEVHLQLPESGGQVQEPVWSGF